MTRMARATRSNFVSGEAGCARGAEFSADRDHVSRLENGAGETKWKEKRGKGVGKKRIIVERRTAGYIDGGRPRRAVRDGRSRSGLA